MVEIMFGARDHFTKVTTMRNTTTSLSMNSMFVIVFFLVTSIVEEYIKMIKFIQFMQFKSKK